MVLSILEFTPKILVYKMKFYPYSKHKIKFYSPPPAKKKEKRRRNGIIHKLFLQNWAASWQNQQCGCAPSEDSDQFGHPPSLIRVFAVRMKKGWILSYPLNAQWRLWSYWADAQADLSLRCAHSHIVGLSWGGSNTDHSSCYSGYLASRPSTLESEPLKSLRNRFVWMVNSLIVVLNVLKVFGSWNCHQKDTLDHTVLLWSQTRAKSPLMT